MAEKEYRTQEQFEEICESALNGNRSYAADKAIEYGFYAVDLIEYQELFITDNIEIVKYPDLLTLIELMTEKRHKTN